MRSTQPGWMSSVTIGYGLGRGYFLALAWVAGFTGIGKVRWKRSTSANIRR